MPIKQVEGVENKLEVIAHTPEELGVFQKIRDEIEKIYMKNEEIRSSSNSNE